MAWGKAQKSYFYMLIREMYPLHVKFTLNYLEPFYQFDQEKKIHVVLIHLIFFTVLIQLFIYGKQSKVVKSHPSVADIIYMGNVHQSPNQADAVGYLPTLDY